MRPESTAQGFLWRAAVAVVNFFSIYLIHILVAKLLGAVTYGLFGVWLSVLLWVRMLMGHGLVSATTRFLLSGEYHPPDVLKKSLVLHYSVAAVTAVAIFFFSPNLAVYLKDPATAPYFRLIAVDVFAYGSLIFILHLQHAYRRYRAASLATLAVALLRLIFVGFAFLFKWGLTGLCFAYLASPLLVFFAMLPLAIKLKPVIQAGTEKAPVPYSKLIRFFVFQTGFVVFHELILVVNLINAKRFTPDERVIGYYVGLSSLCKLPHMILIFALSGVMLTAFSEAFSEHRRELIQHYFSQTVRILLLLILPYGILIYAAIEPILRILFTERFAEISGLFIPYFTGITGLTFLYVFSLPFQARNQPHLPFWIAAVILISQFIFSALFPARWGIAGSGYAVLASGLLALVLLFWLLARQAYFQIPVRPCLKILVAAGLTAFVIMVPAIAHAAWPWKLLLGAGFYGVAVFVLRAVNRGDFTFLKTRKLS